MNIQFRWNISLRVFRSGVALVFLCSAGCVTVPTATSSAKVGESVTMVVTAEGTPPFNFRWEKNGRPISDESGATIVIRQVKRSDAGVYVCFVSNSMAEASGRHRLIVVDR